MHSRWQRKSSLQFVDEGAAIKTMRFDSGDSGNHPAAMQCMSDGQALSVLECVQMFIGDGAKLVRDAFALAKEKSPCIIFIDEIDAIGTKRFDSEVSGDREVQRTMLELLNQLDGFSSDDNIKVCML